jgi:hypothetical protein
MKDLFVMSLPVMSAEIIVYLQIAVSQSRVSRIAISFGVPDAFLLSKGIVIARPCRSIAIEII